VITPPTSSTAQRAVAFSIVIPKSAPSTSSTRRKPTYIPSTTGSIAFTLLSVNGVAQTNQPTQGPFNLSPTNNPNCSVLSNGNTSCSFSINAPVGQGVIFLATTYTSNNGTGTPLGSGAVLLNVAQNAANTANLVLTGPVASVTLLSSTTTLYNGNPVPPPTYSESHARRMPQSIGTPNPSPSPTSTPVATTSRIFVIALDAAGNQIINPTTFDIPITVQLNLNGLPAGDVTLTVNYAGLPGEPASPASTSTDGGTVTIDAPSDTLTLAITTSSTSNTISQPTLVAEYTPQGGTPQTSTPLTYSVSIPPPAAQFALAISTAAPLVQNTPGTIQFSLQNTGNLAATGSSAAITLEFALYATDDSAATFVNFGTTDTTFWSCPTPQLYYEEIYDTCTSTGTIAAGATAPPVQVVFTTTSVGAGAHGSAYGGGAINEPYVQSTFTTASPAPTTTPSPSGIVANPSSVTFPNTSASNSVTVSLGEPYFTGSFSTPNPNPSSSPNACGVSPYTQYVAVTPYFGSGNQGQGISSLVVTNLGATTSPWMCTVMVNDSLGHSVQIPVSYTTLSVTGS
jgi:hypothetical protein